MNKVQKMPRPTGADHLVCDPTRPSPWIQSSPSQGPSYISISPSSASYPPGFTCSHRTNPGCERHSGNPRAPSAPHLNPYLCIQPQNAPPLEAINWAQIPFSSVGEAQAIQEVSGPVGIPNLHSFGRQFLSWWIPVRTTASREFKPQVGLC